MLNKLLTINEPEVCLRGPPAHLLEDLAVLRGVVAGKMLQGVHLQQ
jgi:hypothetical protein